MNSLPLFHRIAGQPVIVLGDGEAALAKRRLIERAGGVVTTDENADARLAFVALGQPEEAAARLKARGLLVNVVDRPELCDFITPSLLERGPVVIAVGTGGVSAGLAKALRMRLEAILPQSLGALAEALGAAKARLRAIWPDPVQRRMSIDAALVRGGVADPMLDFNPDQFNAWLEAGETGGRFMHGARIELVLSSDDPDDLTLGEARLLASADLVIHDADIAPAILFMARADAARCLTGENPPAVGGSLTLVLRRG